MITVQAALGKKQDPISKVTRAKKGWRCGSSGRLPAWVQTLVSTKKQNKTKPDKEEGLCSICQSSLLSLIFLDLSLQVWTLLHQAPGWPAHMNSYSTWSRKHYLWAFMSSHTRLSFLSGSLSQERLFHVHLKPILCGEFREARDFGFTKVYGVLESIRGHLTPLVLC
jgi:hypothetical protein